MRALALPALVAASFPLLSLVLVACDQDYASSTSGRETFMGLTHEVPPASGAPATPPPPMAPPQFGPVPTAAAQPAMTGAADAGADAAKPAGSAPRLPHPALPPGH